jgi:hypothetical protein
MSSDSKKPSSASDKEIEEAMAEYNAMLAQQQDNSSWLVNLAIYSGISFARIAFINPIVRVGTILNTEAELVRQGILAKPLGGIRGAIKHLYLTEGLFRSIVRGTLSDALMLLPVRIVEEIASTSVSGFLQRSVGSSMENWSQLRLIVVSIAASAFTMTLCVPIAYPREAIMGRMHCDVTAAVPTAAGGSAPHKYRYSGPIAAFKSFSTYTKLFSGAAVGVANFVCYRAALYLSINGLSALTGGHPSKALTIACTFFAMIVHHPLDVIRQRLVVSGDGPKPHASPVACARHIVKSEGFKGLYRGLKFQLLVTTLNVAFVELLG